MGKSKNPHVKFPPDAKKIPRIAEDPNDFYRHRPAWRIGILQMAHPYGWHEVTAAELASIRTRLTDFETMTWREILIDGKKGNHLVKINRLCGEAQARLNAIFHGRLDIDQLVSLRFGGTERIWGLLEGATMKVLWWDPDHAVCPALLRHT